MDWQFAAFVVWREMLHLCAGYASVPLFQGIWFEMRRKGWLPKLSGFAFGLVPAVLVVGIGVGVREPYDAQNDPPWKSTLDGIFWALGILAAVWMQVRYRSRTYAWTVKAVQQLGPRRSYFLGFHPNAKPESIPPKDA